MVEDFEQCYRAVSSKDGRFDGWFVTAVTTTGIYCRPSCPAVTPKRGNVRFLPTAAAAQRAGFRACKRCRPDASPGSPEWNMRADTVGRAMRLIADGSVDRDGVSGLARRLGFSERHLHRQLVTELGAGPLALARAQRAHTARLLIETSELPFTEVAFAAGFPSIRQFNETVREVFGTTPTELRSRSAHRGDPATGALTLRLRCRPPFDGAGLLAFLALRAVPGVELVDGSDAAQPLLAPAADVPARTYRRVLSLPHGLGLAALTPRAEHVDCTLRLRDMRDLSAAVERCRRLLDLDADPLAVDGALGGDTLLGPLVRATPGLRVPGTVDGTELAVRAVLGQQVSVGGARTLAGRLAQEHGARLAEELPSCETAAGAADADRGSPDTDDGAADANNGAADAIPALTRAFPTAAAIAALDPEQLPMPRARGRALVGLCAALADGAIQLDPGADREQTRADLLALPGIGPWTAEYVAMRALGDPDAFPATDLGIRHAFARLDAASSPTGARRTTPPGNSQCAAQPHDARAVAAIAERWRPWRAYAALHLWATLTPTEGARS
ncbi:AlkA N-terminal domain-containing protein [Conexibacter sp. JD483]|uniref:DNA-3-methyladenine glycosylase 2 family protein n=1 Tax=unclassified Conexibacter TaxID=2627773 RepID=UPI00271E2039|nr:MULTISPECIES: AlkA N-terminal domain-containing protein [unclassified Conexibacter]MDO8186260.1 AlkA N-terminal domain-containing protein [Conexibacter sp. CPCC 205706]MDO8199673.1 AlkA N-terminal domain-containing protein [Conexibacter sp. CPCC 205762]MDR9372497.1 AlkA N-terminal domain-containing protein [Conexibacter sp. JD483]